MANVSNLQTFKFGDSQAVANARAARDMGKFKVSGATQARVPIWFFPKVGDAAIIRDGVIVSDEMVERAYSGQYADLPNYLTIDVSIQLPSLEETSEHAAIAAGPSVQRVKVSEEVFNAFCEGKLSKNMPVKIALNNTEIESTSKDGVKSKAPVQYLSFAPMNTAPKANAAKPAEAAKVEEPENAI